MGCRLERTVRGAVWIRSAGDGKALLNGKGSLLEAVRQGRPLVQFHHQCTGRAGFLDVARLDLTHDVAVPVPAFRTRSVDGVVAPEPLPDGSGLLALGLHARGFDVRRVEAARVPGPDVVTGAAT